MLSSIIINSILHKIDLFSNNLGVSHNFLYVKSLIPRRKHLNLTRIIENLPARGGRRGAAKHYGSPRWNRPVKKNQKLGVQKKLPGTNNMAIT